MTDEQLEDTLRAIIMDLCEVLYINGYQQVPVGAMMRLIGIPDDRAQQHDNEFFSLDNEFQEQLAKHKLMSTSAVPPGTVLH